MSGLLRLVSSPSPSLPSAICLRYHTFEIAGPTKKRIFAPLSTFQKHAYPCYVFDFKILYLYNVITRLCRQQASNIQGVPGGKDNILGGHSIGHSKQNTLYEHVSYSERFPR
jgi:hypothetical protein